MTIAVTMTDDVKALKLELERLREDIARMKSLPGYQLMIDLDLTPSDLWRRVGELKAENSTYVDLHVRDMEQKIALQALLHEARDYLKYPAPHKNPTELEDRIDAALGEE